MSRAETLHSLEQRLENFLDKVVTLKSDRIDVLTGISGLDDIARQRISRSQLADQVGDWFASHRQWLQDDRIRSAERKRISNILGHIREDFKESGTVSPATRKIVEEIDNWQTSWSMMPPEEAKPKPPSVTLRRGPETAGSDLSSIDEFNDTLDRIKGLFEDFQHNRQHLMSVLDSALVSATAQRNRAALNLAGFMIYFLKQKGYKVQPFVKRLKEAEELLGTGDEDA